MNVYPWHKKVTNYLRVFGWTFLILGGLFGLAVWFLTGCGLKAGVQEAGHDATTETGTVKIATSAPVAEVEAKIETALVQQRKKIENTINAARDQVTNSGIGWKELATAFGIYALYSLAKDWLFQRARRRYER